MKKIEFEELKKWLEIEEINLVEVFSKEDFNDTKEERYSNIPLGVAAEEASGQFPKDDPIVVYGSEADEPSCQNVARQLEEVGFKEVYYYTGSTREWKELGFPVK